jgi:hypothetical protein
MSTVQTENHTGPVPVYENFFLVSAASRNEAVAKAHEIGRLEMEASFGNTLNGQPAETTFLGVRKVRTIYTRLAGPDSTPPADGDELTHSFFTVDDMNAARALAEGKAVEVTYIDSDRDIT